MLESESYIYPGRVEDLQVIDKIDNKTQTNCETTIRLRNAALETA